MCGTYFPLREIKGNPSERGINNEIAGFNKCGIPVHRDAALPMKMPHKLNV